MENALHYTIQHTTRILLGWLITMSVGFGQSKVSGTVFNEKLEVVGDVLIAVGQGEYIKTNRNGSFQVSPKVFKQKYELTDFSIPGYRVKKIDGNSSFNIFVTPATQLRGRVIDKLKRNKRFKVTLQDENENEETTTQIDGSFLLNNISANLLTSTSKTIKFWIDDIEVDNKHIKFQNNKAEVVLFVPNEQESSEDVDISYEDGTPEEIIKDDKKNTKEEKDDFIKEFTKITENLLDDRQEQQKRAKRLRTELATLTRKFAADKNITPEEREKLIQYMGLLEETFLDNDSLFASYQQESKAEIAKMQQVILQKDSLNKVATKYIAKVEGEKKRIQAEKELNELRFRTNIFIYSVILIVLLLLVFVFLFYNNVIKQQRNQLKIAHNRLAEKIEEINQQNEEISTQRDDLDAKSKQLEYVYGQITASIVSAERIQHAILDSKEEILENFKEGFVIYYPRNIVSGDFYWSTRKDDIVTLGVIDCTGHGVPGAFMTMLGHSLLNYIINEQGITRPNEVLTLLDKQVHQALHQNNKGDNYVGMDMALLCFDYKEKVVHFAGAKHYVLRISQGQIIEMKGAKFPIGMTKFKTDYHFEEQTFPLLTGDCFYLQSDGLQDQMTETEGRRKKFSKKRYTEFILAHHQLPFHKQKKCLEEVFADWQNKEQQTDDVTVVGVKIK